MSRNPHPDLESLLQRLCNVIQSDYGFGTLSCSVYDTAWVANVVKTVDGVTQYLFPSSFLSILNAQQPDGHWDGHFVDNSQILPSNLHWAQGSNHSDAIISTMASLYTLIVHFKNPHQISSSRLPFPPLGIRIEKGARSLELMLLSWKIDGCNTVGLEVLVPEILNLLSGHGYEFEFPAKEKLFRIRDSKISRIEPHLLYGPAPLALLHSLKAFHGWSEEKLDVGKMKHHLVNGSMMASPAATASYLIKNPQWDDSAEAYLRMVVQCSEGGGSGAVPSAWPSTTFEILWVVCTMAEFDLFECSATASQSMAIIQAIMRSIDSRKGLAGFAPGIEADLDDSAKASLFLSIVGKEGFAPLIAEEFDATACLRTYRGERDPSVSANCNALMSLLHHSKDFPRKLPTIEKIVHFVSESWEIVHGNIQDKWNLSPFYTIMLISRSFSELIIRWQTKDIKDLCDELVIKMVAPILTKCLWHVLHTQGPRGSWGKIGPFEETAYAVLALVALSGLPFPEGYLKRISIATQRGRNFLSTRGSASAEFLWIEKVTYGSRFLMDAFILTALHTRVDALSRSRSSADQGAEPRGTTSLSKVLRDQLYRR